MKKILLILAVLALLPRAQSETPAPTGDRDVLLKLEQDWAEAVARHDAAFLERVEADSYVYTDATGCVAHKADDIAGAKAGDFKIDAFKLGDMQVQVHGDAAVMTGQTTLAGSDRNGPFGGVYRWTDVFIRTDGNWQVVASQATALKAEEAVVAPAGTPGTDDD